MEFLCDKKYIILPASHNAVKKRLYFYIEDDLVYDLLVSLEYDTPDYLFPVNMERFIGKTIRIECDKNIDIHFDKTDTVPEEHSGKYRPYAHFTAMRGWINDPNGLVQYKGKYLMFFQHNPAATTWENMHWGAAESNDLIHWKEKGDVLFPNKYGTVFSGSGIVDKYNISGLKRGDDDPILFFYTRAGSTSEASKGRPFTQNLAYSVDGGNTVIEYSKPLIEQITEGNRDPKVIWYEADRCFIMALYLEGHEFALFRSYDVFNWKELQRITLPDDAECPDIYPLAVNGTDEVRWIFSAASDRYYIGCLNTDGFTPETKQLRINYGNVSYAAQSWSDVADGRRIRTAFASVVIPGMPFGSCMDIPQEMALKKVKGALRLCANPVSEIRSLYNNTKLYENIVLDDKKAFKHTVSSKCCDIEIIVKTGASFTISLFGLDVIYDNEHKLLRCMDKDAPVFGEDGVVRLRIIIDTVYAELIADSGSVFMGMKYIQDTSLDKFTVYGNDLCIKALSISEMNRYYHN